MSAFLAALVMICTAVTFFVLLFLVAFILVRGVRFLTPDLFSFTYTSDNASLMPALINTLTMTALSLVIAVPIGGLPSFSVEYSGRGSKLVGIIRVTAEILSPVSRRLYTDCLDFCFCDDIGDGDFPAVGFLYVWSS